MLEYSSMGPEDMGYVEENTHDYVYIVLNYACIGVDDAVSCLSTLPWALRLWTLTKRACTIMLTPSPALPHGFVMKLSDTTASTRSHGLW